MTSPDRALQTDARIAALRVIATGRPQILDGIAVIEDELTGLRAYAVDTRRRLDDTRDAQVHALQRLDECQARATQLENTLRAILDVAARHGEVRRDDPELAEARALLNGDSAPAERLQAVAAAADAVYGKAGWIGVPPGYRSVPHDLIVALGESLRAPAEEEQ